jgi:hypothetical protein
VLADIVGPAVASDATTPDAPIGHHVVVLDRAHRFEEASVIADLADAVRLGDADRTIALLAEGHSELRWVPERGDSGFRGLWAEVVARRARLVELAAAGDISGALEALTEMAVLCARREGPEGVAHWRRNLEAALDERFTGLRYGGEWYPGRPVMVTKNDYDLELYNGDIGVTVATDEGLRVAFDRGGSRRFPLSHLGEHVTNHAMTIHKSQGSQFRSVVVVLPREASRLLTRELLYTAVTRASARVWVVGDEAVVRAAVERSVQRASGLGARLWGRIRCGLSHLLWLPGSRGPFSPIVPAEGLSALVPTPHRAGRSTELSAGDVGRASLFRVWRMTTWETWWRSNGGYAHLLRPARESGPQREAAREAAGAIESADVSRSLERSRSSPRSPRHPVRRTGTSAPRCWPTPAPGTWPSPSMPRRRWSSTAAKRGSLETVCEELEDADLAVLPDVRSGVGRARILAWIDKPEEPGERIGFVVEVTDALVDLTIVSGNPAKPTGDHTELVSLVPGTYVWVNDACSVDDAGMVSCDPASTSAISHIDVCITAEVGAVCPAPPARPVVVRNEGSIPLAVAVSFDDMAVEPAEGALCDGEHLGFELADDADPPEVRFSGDVCDGSTAAVDLGVLDPGASAVVMWRLIPGPALGATHNGTTLTFDVNAVGTVWAVPGAWESSAHVPVTVTLGGAALPLPPAPDDPADVVAPGDEPPGDEPPPVDPPAVDPPAAEPPPAEPPPVEPPPGGEPPGGDDPADEPPPAVAPPPGDDEPDATYGYVRLAGHNERIEGTGRDSGEGGLAIVLLAAVDDWTTGEERVLLSQWGPEPADRSFLLGITPDGGLQLLLYDAGLVTFDTGAAGLADGEWAWLKVVLEAEPQGAHPRSTSTSAAPIRPAILPRSTGATRRGR